MQRPTILDRFQALADATRSRLLLVLARQELTVGEICEVLRLPQSTVSRHLKILAEGSWVRSRPEGTHRLYRLDPGTLEPSARSLWRLAREEVSPTAVAEEDRRRLAHVLAKRRSRSEEFFAASAGDWDRVRAELFGQTPFGVGLLTLLDPEWRFADLGCGTGILSETVAPFVRELVAVDDSGPMLEACGARISRYDNAEVRRGRLEQLPIEDAWADAATLVLVLHHVADPVTVLAEAARVLRPGGRLVVLDMLPHDRAEYREQMGHVWLGFSRDQLARHLEDAGLELRAFHELDPDPDARGPGLFAARASAPDV